VWALFSYDVLVGTASTVEVRRQVLDKLTTLPDGQSRDVCELLEDTVMCHVDNFDDFERLNNRLAALRLQLEQQFNYALSLNRANDPLAVRGPHDVAAKNSIRTS
jgi:hypothetical protein